MTEESTIRIGIVGAGVVGRSVAADFALNGHAVALVDSDPQALEAAPREIANALRFAKMMRRDLPARDLSAAADSIVYTDQLSRVADCAFIIENIHERWSSKEALYRQLGTLCRDDAILCVNTSCLSVTRIASLAPHPARVVGAHFMNPSYMKKRVEVMKGMRTSDESVEAVKALLAEIGKECTVVNDSPGFVSNRLSHLLMNEAAFVVQEGVASPEQVDEIFKDCFGHAMGPLETADLIGLDTVVDSLRALYEDLQDTKFRCCPLLRRMVDAGQLGRKSGRGFFAY